jgi:hypothetical protein
MAYPHPLLASLLVAPVELVIGPVSFPDVEERDLLGTEDVKEDQRQTS